MGELFDGPDICIPAADFPDTFPLAPNSYCGEGYPDNALCAPNALCVSDVCVPACAPSEGDYVGTHPDCQESSGAGMCLDVDAPFGLCVACEYLGPLDSDGWQAGEGDSIWWENDQRGQPAFSISLYQQFPGPGVYDLGSPGNDNYATCTECVVGFDGDITHFQESGTLELTSYNGPGNWEGTAMGVLIPVVVDANDWTSTPIPGLESRCYNFFVQF
ncbi:MAG: hypothetical protein R6X02_19120 [Enhygromyxa sp.]